MNEMDEMNEMTDEGEVLGNEKRKRVVVPSVIYTLGDNWRVVIDDSESMILQKKVKYTDGSENWIFDGFFSDLESMCKDVQKSNPKEKALKYGGGTILDLIRITKEAYAETSAWFNEAKGK